MSSSLALFFLQSVKEHKRFFFFLFPSMYNKTIIRFGHFFLWVALSYFTICLLIGQITFSLFFKASLGVYPFMG